MPTIFVPGGHVVTLVLVEVKDSSFYLRIPSRIINALCLKSRKYLLYLGWCILGVEGYLTHTRNGRKLNTEGNLEDRGVYYYAAVSPGMFYFMMLLLSWLHIGRWPYAMTICSTKISSILSTSRSSKPRRPCLRKPHTPVTSDFVPICRTVKAIVHGQESRMELGCISFPIAWVLNGFSSS